jgi:hypothetical protein
MPGLPNRESDPLTVLLANPDTFIQVRIYHRQGKEKPIQDKSHCTLRHGLRNLHGISSKEKSLRGVLFAGP